ncbi:unnamed protein product, partial [Ixodes hexagonus]
MSARTEANRDSLKYKSAYFANRFEMPRRIAGPSSCLPSVLITP